MAFGRLLMAVLFVLPLVVGPGPWARAAGEVRPARLVKAALTTKKVMALTFDDGPNRRYTPRVIELLKRNGAKATFFVIGREVVRFPDMVKAERDAGFEVANHGMHHRFLKGLDEAAVTEDVRGGEEAIEAAGGGHPTLYRLPGGVSDATAMAVLGRLGYTVVGWSIDCRDWRPGMTADRIEKIILDEAGPGKIIILHDGPARRDATLQAVERVLPKLRAQGYRLVTVSELLREQRSAGRA
jgi:peptidoglycan/xylan/chitin deacetylase (PgdA/CDA1 family)